MNRFHKVPVIHTNDGFKLSETVAIYHFLGRQKIIPYPEENKEIAKIDEYLSWQHSSLLLSIGKIFYETWIKPFRNINIVPHGSMVNVARPLDYVELEQSLNDLEHIWLGDNKFIVGDKITFADLIATCAINQLVGMKMYTLDEVKYPKIASLMRAVNEHFNPEFDHAHKMIFSFGAKFNGKPPTYLIYANDIMRKFKKIFK